MTVCVLAPAGASEPSRWATEQVSAAIGFGAEACLVGFQDGEWPALPDQCRVLLFQDTHEPRALAAFLKAPPLVGKRRILALRNPDEHDPAQALALFACADMVILDPACVARLFGLDREPDTVQELAVLRPVLTLSNQAAVVTLGSGGAVAIWTDRHMESPPIQHQAMAAKADPFCAIVSACVDLGIGPEPALRYALAGRALQAQGKPMPTRAALDAALGHGAA